MADRVVTLPAFSPTMTEATLDRWMVGVGDAVDKGDVIAEVTTDKATLDLEADAAGVVTALLVEAGTARVAVNTPLARIGAADGAAPARPRPAAQTVREALQQALADAMAADETVVVIGEEVGRNNGAFKITEGLLDRFGSSRVIDAPTTPSAFTGLAAGAAMNGLRPVVEYLSFSYALQAMEHLANAIAAMEAVSAGQFLCPIVLRGPHGPLAGVGPHVSHDVASLMMRFPGLKVVAPFRAADAGALLREAIHDEGPVIFLESERLYGQAFTDHAGPATLGAARVAREGRDVTLVSFGAAMTVTLEAADALEAEGVSVAVIDLCTLNPLDLPALTASLKATNRCVIVEEGPPRCSVGDHIAATLMREAFDWLDAPVLTVTAADAPTPYAPALAQATLVSAAKVLAAVRTIL